jgi:Domain of unknown function (DUF4282)
MSLLSAGEVLQDQVRSLCQVCREPLRRTITGRCSNCGAQDGSPIRDGAPSQDALPSLDALPSRARIIKEEDMRANLPSTSQPGFFKVLFDVSFENFIYVRVARSLYLFGLVLGALTLVIFEIIVFIEFLNGFRETSGSFDTSAQNYYMQSIGWPLVGILIAMPIVYLLLVILIRLSLESGVALIKIAENTKKK